MVGSSQEELWVTTLGRLRTIALSSHFFLCGQWVGKPFPIFLFSPGSYSHWDALISGSLYVAQINNGY